jgi:hypothetical protein
MRGRAVVAHIKREEDRLASEAAKFSQMDYEAVTTRRWLLT